MATLCRVLLLLLIFSDSIVSNRSVGVGINYGQIANNLPAPSRVAFLLSSLNISRVKLYDADPTVLSAFANTDVEFVIGLGNEYLQKMSDPVQAQAWLQQHVKPYISETKIKCITVGNEVLTGNNTQLMSYLLPAMQTMNEALVNLGLSKEIYVTTAHSFGILSSSFPPSTGAFRQDLAEYMQSILSFHTQTHSPFLINAYPFFAYKDNPDEISLSYALFQPSSGTVDTNTNLHYDNMLYAQIDAVYSAIKAMGHTDIQVKVSETGWPSKGDVSEVGATPENARLYNGNLLKRLQQSQGTPAKPSVPVDIYVFALFNEDLKPGPDSERNYGLFYPDGTPVYNVGRLEGYLPRMEYSASKKNHETGLCKNLLQEYAQKMNYAIPLYECRKEEKEGRISMYSCVVEIGGIKYIGASASTKKEAEIKAARTALLAIQTAVPISEDHTSNSAYTVIPQKKKASDLAISSQETKSPLKPKKGRFKKQYRKKRRPTNRDGSTGGTTHLEVNTDGQAGVGLPVTDAASSEPDAAAGFRVDMAGQEGMKVYGVDTLNSHGKTNGGSNVYEDIQRQESSVTNIGSSHGDSGKSETCGTYDGHLENAVVPFDNRSKDWGSTVTDVKLL